MTTGENGKGVYDVVTEHKTRTRRAAKGIGASKPANQSFEIPVAQAQLPSDQPTARDTQTTNSLDACPQELEACHRHSAYQLPGPAGGYWGSHFYHGLPAVQQGFGAPWVNTDDSGYVSAVSPSSYDGSSTAHVDMMGDGGVDAAANTMGLAG